MFVYQELENICTKFENISDWYCYPWHSDPGCVTLPGKFIKSLFDSNTAVESYQIIEECYNNIGLSCLKFQFDKSVYVPDLSLNNVETVENISEVMNIPEEIVTYNVIEAAIIGYLKTKGIIVHGIVYGSYLHKKLNKYIQD